MKLAPAFLMVIFLAVCAYAQTDQPNATPPSNAPATDQTAPSANQTQAEPATAQSSTDTTSDANSTTIRGCLEGGTDRGYTLTDKNGTRYALTGTNVNALISDVGEEVDLDGEPAPAPGSDISGTGSATTESATDKPAATPSQTFKVSDVRKVSDKCAM
jgi:hypothetical protein